MNDKLKYVVNQEEGVVACIATNCCIDLFDDIEKQFSSLPNPLFDLFSSSFTADADLFKDCLALPNDVVGIAKLHPSDTWDEEKGKKIARLKMRKKYNNIKSKQIEKMATILRELSDTLSEKKPFYENKNRTYEADLTKF